MASGQDVVERLNAALTDRYRIESEIGTGGMATVFLARDLRHDRKVAVKILAPELAAAVGTERFLAEIRTTANLSHPHILPLHDSGEADGFLFYVMPYVKGESLRERLDREGQLSVEEAVQIAGRVAEAMDHAHRQNVIHRDIKPANILFQDDEPVVADFGIALAVNAAGEGRLTETGLSLGTPYYMSPEQAAGEKHPTAASDVYSLGCVLYEMLTGDPPHTGSSAQAILGKILLGEVTPPTKLRRTIPPNVEAAILKSLERLPADRFASTADLAAALRDGSFRHGETDPGRDRSVWWKRPTVGLSAVTLLALAWALAMSLSTTPSPPSLWQRIHPPGEDTDTTWARHFALAPDGSSMVYRVRESPDGDWELWIKGRGDMVGRALPGTRNARDVVYSPDGQWIAYFVGTDLVKQPLQGGVGVPLLNDVNDPLHAALDWMDDQYILCEQTGNTLVRIPENGGAPADTVFQFFPDKLIRARGLPGGDAALAVACYESSCPRGSGLYAVDIQADTAWVIRDGVLDAWYLPSGHVVWVRRDGAVFATSFDERHLELGEDDQPLFEGVLTTTQQANMELGTDGTVVFLRGEFEAGGRRPVWVDREGEETPIENDLPVEPWHPALSPDGNALAVMAARPGEEAEIWVTDLRRGSSSRLTFEGGYWPFWHPGGELVSFHSRRGGTRDLWSKRADGSGQAMLLADWDRDMRGPAWSPDSAWVAFETLPAGAGPADIWAWPVGRDDTPLPVAVTEFNEQAPVFSPDSRVLAYVSEESGEPQVYVTPVPGTNDWQELVSRGGGTAPVWSQDGRELFYRKSSTGELVAVEVISTDPFQIGVETALFSAAGYTPGSYDVAPDGQRFLMLRPVGESEVPSTPQMYQILNWFTELRERLANRN